MATFKPAECRGARCSTRRGRSWAREAEASLEAGDLPGPLAGLISSYVEQKSLENEDLRGTLYLNASNPLIRRLAQEPDRGRSARRP